MKDTTPNKKPRIKPINAFCVVKIKNGKIKVSEVYDTDDIEITKDEEVIKVIIKQWTKQ